MIKSRFVVALVFAVGFVVEVAELAVTSVGSGWLSLSDLDKSLIVFSLVVELAGVILAFWAHEDREKINQLLEAVAKLTEQKDEKIPGSAAERELT